ncbi:helix-turn-helix transcriptional regulator [Methylobacterium goesingense]|uniref:AraC-like DNA-binding protein n=1 Tax=Methylobacterium goesingense TaxID=243690 RepID=A0ABV2LAB8_9HYPH|nr:helix-turn-helix transcriptional regulator [Methylobacterium goesingense]GJD75789.1 HTH-type transcriptional activator RhaR [Methylobacterium goesingense]
MGFEDLREVEASGGFAAVSATLRVADLATAHAALTGGDPLALPRLAPVAEIASPGMRALFCTVREVRRQVQEAPRSGDLLVPLVREIMAYQLLSVWPRQTAASAAIGREGAPRSLQTALDYIMANLGSPLMLADIAAAAGISVRSLQDRFRRDLGQTPVRFLIDQRLEHAHRDLLSPGNTLSVAAIARRWGFAHPSNFGQRYRNRYGCTPSATRHEAGRAP